jgi:hypothetical protein
VVRTTTVAQDRAERFDATFGVPAPAGRDGWVILRARGDRPHPAFASRRPSWGFTNPVLLDRDGDGRWGRRGLRARP